MAKISLVPWRNVFVFGALVFAYTNKSGDAHSSLLLAIIFQLMALTFFVIKK